MQQCPRDSNTISINHRFKYNTILNCEFHFIRYYEPKTIILRNNTTYITYVLHECVGNRSYQ